MSTEQSRVCVRALAESLAGNGADVEELMEMTKNFRRLYGSDARTKDI